jgi:glycosyltransferase involved in cell wall biosynthesis
VRRRALIEAVHAFAPDAVHCHDLNTVAVGLAVDRRRRCAVVWDSHELYEDLSTATSTHKAMARWQQRAYSRRIDRFVTINDSIARTLLERYPRLPEPVIVRNAAICPDAPPADDGRLRRAAGVEPGRRILLYQGGFARFRGLEALVRSGAMLPESWVLVMMGWGAREAALRAIAAECDPSGERIRFIPPAAQSELLHWTAGAQLGVIPYENVCLNHWYCTPNKLWEYPAAGVPMLVSQFPELSRVVQEHGIGRLLTDPVSPQEIAAAVAALTDETLSTMRQRCREFIVRDNWSVYASRLLALYGRLLDPASDRVAALQVLPVEIGDG